MFASLSRVSTSVSKFWKEKEFTNNVMLLHAEVLNPISGDPCDGWARSLDVLKKLLRHAIGVEERDSQERHAVKQLVQRITSARDCRTRLLTDSDR